MDKYIKDFINSKLSFLNEYKNIFTYYYVDEDETEYADFYSYFLDSYTYIDYDWCKNGVTKLCFHFHEFPQYVIKIPFRGKAVVLDNNEGIISEDEFLVDPLCACDVYDYEGAAHNGYYDIEDIYDYCEAENYVYDKAIDNCVDEFVASTEYLCSINDIPIYISTYVEEEYDESEAKENVQSTSLELAKKYKKKYEYMTPFSIVKLALFIQQYGILKAHNFIRFLNNYAVEDFHDGNFGFDEEGKLKLIDYSSFDIYDS